MIPKSIPRTVIDSQILVLIFVFAEWVILSVELIKRGAENLPQYLPLSRINLEYLK